MFEKRWWISDVFTKLGVGAKNKTPDYMEVRKSTSFGGAGQRRAEIV